MPWLCVHVLQPLVVESEVVEIDLADAPLEVKVVASTHRHQVWLDDQRPIGCYCILEQTLLSSRQQSPKQWHVQAPCRELICESLRQLLSSGQCFVRPLHVPNFRCQVEASQQCQDQPSVR